MLKIILLLSKLWFFKFKELINWKLFLVDNVSLSSKGFFNIKSSLKLSFFSYKFPLFLFWLLLPKKLFRNEYFKSILFCSTLLSIILYIFCSFGNISSLISSTSSKSSLCLISLFLSKLIFREIGQLFSRDFWSVMIFCCGWTEFISSCSGLFVEFEQQISFPIFLLIIIN